MPLDVAIAVMPWVPAQNAPAGPAALKSRLRERGFRSTVYHFQLDIFSRLGERASAFGKRDISSRLGAEWLFAYHLFGARGSGELSETPRELRAREFFRRFMRRTGAAPEFLESVAEREIPGFLRRCLEETPWKRHGLVVFPVLFNNTFASLKLSLEIKRRFPETRVMLAGSAGEDDLNAAEILKGCEWLDYASEGDAERSVLAVAGDIESGGRGAVPGAYRRRGSRVLAPASPLAAPGREEGSLPDHGDYFRRLKSLDLDGKIRPVVMFEASRGCWWGERQHCSFCGLNGRDIAYRPRDSAAVLKEVRELWRKHRPPYLQTADAILSLDHLREIVPRIAELRREGALGCRFFFTAKANLSRAQIESLAEAGTVAVHIGIESFSTRLLRSMRKGLTAIQNIQALKLLSSCGIDAQWNLLYGIPGETAADYDASIGAISAIAHLQPPLSVGPVTVARFSPYHSRWRELGAPRPRPHEAYRFLYPKGRFSLEEVAYYFGSLEPKDPALRRKAAALRRAADAWTRTWAGNFLAFEREAGGAVRVYDSRPWAREDGPGAMREARIEGLEAAALSAAETAKSFEAIKAACLEFLPGRGEAAVRRALRVLVEERRWLFHEDGQYLSLAVPAERLSGARGMAFRYWKAGGGPGLG